MIGSIVSIDGGLVTYGGGFPTVSERGLITDWTSLWDLIEQRAAATPDAPFGDRRERARR